MVKKKVKLQSNIALEKKTVNAFVSTSVIIVPVLYPVQPGNQIKSHEHE